MKKQINIVRRRLMRTLTKDIGANGFVSKSSDTKARPIERILISRPNHRLGNLLLITPLLEEVAQTFPEAKVDLFVKGGIAPVLFEKYHQIDRIISLPRKPFKELGNYIKVWTKIRSKKYDLVINVDGTSSSGRLCTQLANATYKIYGPEEEILDNVGPDRKHIAKAPVLLLRDFLKKFGFEPRLGAVPPLDLKLSQQELDTGREVVRNLVKNDHKTICIFTYATGAKCYSEMWWTGLYKRMQEAAPEYNIIEVLPVENVSQIGFQAPTFYSKDVREIGAVIAGTDLFVGADSGIMHLASASGATTMGLFSVTNMLKYAPYNPHSQAMDTNTCEVEELLETIMAKLSQEPGAKVRLKPDLA